MGISLCRDSRGLVHNLALHVEGVLASSESIDYALVISVVGEASTHFLNVASLPKPKLEATSTPAMLTLVAFKCKPVVRVVLFRYV